MRALACVYLQLNKKNSCRNLDVDEIRERQQRAEEIRATLQEAKACRLKELHKRVRQIIFCFQITNGKSRSALG